MTTYQRVQKTHKADREGKGNGYCAECGMMLMYKDACCPKCESIDPPVLDAPVCKVGAKSVTKF
jgi:uncharacterized OB-fold protein